MTESRNSLKNGHQEAQEREENLRAEKDSNNNNNNNSFVGTVVLELKSKFKILRGYKPTNMLIYKALETTNRVSDV